jgi:hypothetical protein
MSGSVITSGAEADGLSPGVGVGRCRISLVEDVFDVQPGAPVFAGRRMARSLDADDANLMVSWLRQRFGFEFGLAIDDPHLHCV